MYNNYENSIIIDNFIYYKRKKVSLSSFLFVLPKNTVNEVIKVGHSSVFSGHLGTKKTCSRILSRFFRPHLKVAINEYIKNCDLCQHTKNTQPIR